MNTKDIGSLYTKDGQDAWRLLWSSVQSTVCLENLETKARIVGAVGSSIITEFKKLEVEKEEANA